jgi:MFS family permease
LSATSTALVTEAFPPTERGKALGINVTAVYLGLAAGPVLGGVLTEQVGWRSIFYVNIPVAIASLAWGRRLGGERRSGAFRLDQVSCGPPSLSQDAKSTPTRGQARKALTSRRPHH